MLSFYLLHVIALCSVQIMFEGSYGETPYSSDQIHTPKQKN